MGPCAKRCAQSGCASCLARALGAAKAAGSYIGSCIADFSRAVEDSVLSESFAKGPCEHFKKNRIPYSYCLENNEEYKGVFGQTSGRLSAVSTNEGADQPRIEAL